jgi:hypothetical protein
LEGKHSKRERKEEKKREKENSSPYPASFGKV